MKLSEKRSECKNGDKMKKPAKICTNSVEGAVDKFLTLKMSYHDKKS